MSKKLLGIHEIPKGSALHMQSGNAGKYKFVVSDLSSDANITLPGLTGDDTFVFASASQTLASKTLTSAVLNGSISGTSIKDEDDMASDSASHLATQQSIKKYVDDQLTAQDLDFQGDSGGALSIDLDSETLDIAGGTGIGTAGSGNTLTVSIDATVATLAGSQTLTNKALTSPDIDGGNIDGATIATSDVTVGSGKTLDVSAGTLTLADNQIGHAKIADSIPNASLANDGITIGSSDTSLGGTITALVGMTAVAVDNLTLDGNTISTTDTNGDLVLSPNGSGKVSMGSSVVSNVSSPGNDSDAATKGYVDGAIEGLDHKEAVRVTSSTAVTLASALDDGKSFGGVTLASGDRILLKSQTAGAENGIYVVQSSGAPVRAADFDVSADVTRNPFVFVSEGDFADCGFVMTNDGAISLDSTALVFTQFSSSGVILGGDGLTKSGNTLSVNVDDSGIEIDTDSLQLKDNGVTLAKMAGIARGSIISGDANGDPQALAVGSAHTFLQSDGTDLAYVAMSGDATLAAGVLSIGPQKVTNAMLADDAVGAAELADNAVVTDRIQNGAVTFAKMDVNSIDSNQYVDGSIDAEHLGIDVVADQAQHGTKPAEVDEFLLSDTANSSSTSSLSLSFFSSSQSVNSTSQHIYAAAAENTDAYVEGVQIRFEKDSDSANGGNNSFLIFQVTNLGVQRSSGPGSSHKINLQYVATSGDAGSYYTSTTYLSVDSNLSAISGTFPVNALKSLTMANLRKGVLDNGLSMSATAQGAILAYNGSAWGHTIPSQMVEFQVSYSSAGDASIPGSGEGSIVNGVFNSSTDYTAPGWVSKMASGDYAGMFKVDLADIFGDGTDLFGPPNFLAQVFVVSDNGQLQELAGTNMVVDGESPSATGTYSAGACEAYFDLDGAAASDIKKIRVAFSQIGAPLMST